MLYVSVILAVTCKQEGSFGVQVETVTQQVSHPSALNLNILLTLYVYYKLNIISPLLSYLPKYTAKEVGNNYQFRVELASS